MKKLQLFSNDSFFKPVLHYIFTHYSEQIDTFHYLEMNQIKSFEWRIRKDEGDEKINICHPSDSSFKIIFRDETISIDISTIYSNGVIEKIVIPHGCGTNKEHILKSIVLEGNNKDLLIDFVDSSQKMFDEQLKLSMKSSSKTIGVFYWRKDYWNLLFKCPKRPLETLYLKEDQKENLLTTIEDFYSENARDDYLRFGIPYKKIIMIHGIPGSGKTTSIRAIASHFDCDIYMIPISKELTDYGLIDAISFMEEREDRKKIIVIEDIDCIFTDRKKGDDDNGISLQGLLNCFDGFACIEGTLLFITANQPQVLDEAMIRSCRIDHRFEFGFADEYQTKHIFETLLPSQKNDFKKFYKKIKSQEFTTAMLQEFLFMNRNCDSILDKINDFFTIIENNKKRVFEKNKSDFYM